MEKSISPSPWKTIWSKPRETIRRIISINTNYQMKLLVTLYGLLGIFSISQYFSLGINWPLWRILAIGIVFAFIWGYLTTTFTAFSVFLTGKLLGGEGKWKEIRTVFIWAIVPLIVNLATWILLIVLLRKEIFLGGLDILVLSPLLGYVVFAISLSQVVFSIWSFIIIVNGIAEVQNFSVLRSIGNLLLTILVLSLISMLLFSAIFWTCGAFFHEPIMVSI